MGGSAQIPSQTKGSHFVAIGFTQSIECGFSSRLCISFTAWNPSFGCLTSAFTLIARLLPRVCNAPILEQPTCKRPTYREKRKAPLQLQERPPIRWLPMRALSTRTCGSSSIEFWKMKSRQQPSRTFLGQISIATTILLTSKFPSHLQSDRLTFLLAGYPRMRFSLR